MKGRGAVTVLSDPEMELTILSTITGNAGACREALDTLNPDDFTDPGRAFVFAAISEAVSSDLAPELPTITARLIDKGLFPKCKTALADVAQAHTTVNYSDAINRVKNFSELRNLRGKLEYLFRATDEAGANAGLIRSQLQTLTDTKRKSQRSSTIVTLDDLMKKEFPAPRWIIPGLLPDGLSLLAAPPKAGKSWAGLDIAVSLAIGQPVFGRAVDRCKTLFIGLEDPERRLYSRIRKQAGGVPQPTNGYCNLTTKWETGPEGLVKLRNFIKDTETRFVCVDTYGRFQPVRDNNDYQEHTGTMAAIKTLVDDLGVAVLLIHHTKKGSEDTDFINRAVGSIGITGGADNILVLAKKRNQQDGILSITSRDMEEIEFGVTFNADRCRWTITGSAAEVTESKERAEIISVLKSASEPLGPSEVAGALGKNVNAVKFLLMKMANDGMIVKPYRGKYSPLQTTYNTNLITNTNNTNLANLPEESREIPWI